MGMKATSTGEARELIPAKSYLAVVCGVYDLGTQSGGAYGAKHQILIAWELHNRRGPVCDKEGRPLTISQFYTLSFNEKANLRRDVESLLNRTFTEAEAKEGYDVEELLGMTCRLQVEHGFKADNTPKDLVGSIMALDDDDDRPRAQLDHVYFEIGRPGCDVPREVPEWIQKIIKRSPEWLGKDATSERVAPPVQQRRPVPAAVGAADDDDIPF